MARHHYLLVLMAFVRTPPLALCAASPALRLAAEHSRTGCRGPYKIQAMVLSTRQTLPGSMCKTRFLTVYPSVNDTLSSVEECMGWWLRRHTGASISLHWDDYYYQRDFTLPHPIVLLYSLRLTRCYIKDSMAWVPRCRHLQVLRLQNCTFVKPDCTIKWIDKCISLTDVKIVRCECVIDFRTLAKLQHLKYLHIVTNRHVKNMSFLGMCRFLETVHIATPFRFSFAANTIARLPRIRSIHIQSPHVHSVESIRECQLLGMITIKCETLTTARGIAGLPRLKNLEVLCATMKSTEWVGKCPSLKAVTINSDCSSIITISTIAHYIIYINIENIDIDSIEWIRNCSLVEDLYMGPCRRISDLSAIGSLQYLTTLRILQSTVISIRWIEKCFLLKKLSLRYCEGIVDLSPVTSLPSLEKLHIRSNIITSIQCVQHCQSLDSLAIVGSRNIADFSQIGKLNHLRILNLTGTNFTHAEWDQILPCHSLQTLVVSGCLSIVDFSPIAGFRFLVTLDMSGSKVADIKWIQGCKKLECLYIKQCIHIEDFSPIGTLKKLKTVDLSDTKVVGIEWMKDCSALKWPIIIGCKYISGIKSFKKRNPQVIFIRTPENQEKEFAL